MMLADTTVLGQTDAVSPWGVIILLTVVGVVVGMWYVRRFQSDILAAAASPGGAHEAERGETASERAVEEPPGASNRGAEPGCVRTTDGSAVDGAATTPDGNERVPTPVPLPFDSGEPVVTRVTDPVVSPVERVPTPAALSFDECTAAVSAAPDPVVAGVSLPPEPTTLALDALDAAVSRGFDPALLPIRSAQPPVDEAWEISGDAAAEPVDLSGPPTITFSGAIDDRWTVESEFTGAARATGEVDVAGGSTDEVSDRGGEPTDASLQLPRRRLLGVLATMGGAAAFGTAGTNAFFSDTEAVGNNQLVAGSLDLKVDWQEHYSDWSPDEVDGVDEFSMEPADGLVGFPSAAPVSQQSVYVGEADVQTFLDNTAIEAFPDQVATDDPSAATYDALPVELDDDICDLPADLDEVLSHPFRTQGTFGEVGENPQTTAPGDPLVNITDLKPGDFGEVTFSLHLCGNPGYVWLTGGLREAAENGVTEPESESPAEQPGVVELLDAVQVALWYDTGVDGVFGATPDDKDDGEGDNFHHENEALIPLMGSLGDVLTQLESGMFPLDAVPISAAADDVTAGADADAERVTDTSDATRYTSTDEPFDTSGARNLTCTEYGETLGIDGLVGTAVEARVDTDGDGEEDRDVLRDDVGISACGGTLTVDAVDIDAGTITVSTNFPVRVFSVKGGSRGEHIYVWPAPGVVLDGVEFVTPTNPNSGNPAAISNVDVCCGTGDGGAGGQNGARDCLPNSTTAYVGFEWWLPTAVGNEIQTDSIAFDLGFYTEQCRHNDGSGQPPEGSV